VNTYAVTLPGLTSFESKRSENCTGRANEKYQHDIPQSCLKTFKIKTSDQCIL